MPGEERFETDSWILARGATIGFADNAREEAGKTLNDGGPTLAAAKRHVNGIRR